MGRLFHAGTNSYTPKAVIIFLECYSNFMTPHAVTSQRELAKAQRRQRILDAARDIICAQGIESLSAQLIAERAQVSVATLYNLIGSLEAIQKLLLMQLADGFSNALERHLTGHQNSQDPYVALLGFGEATFAFLHEDEANYRSLHRVIFARQFSPAGSNDNLRARHHSATHLQHCLEALRDKKQLMAQADLSLLVEQLLMCQVILLQNWSIELISLPRLRAMLKLQTLQLITPWLEPSAAGDVQHRLQQAQEQIQRLDQRQQPVVATLINTGNPL